MKIYRISLDIVVGSNADGEELAEEAAMELERHGFRVVGIGLQDDVTEEYEN